MRIGLVGPLPPPSGGMATQCEQLNELLKAEGMDVVLVQTNAPYRPPWIGNLRGVRALFRLMPYFASLRRMCARVDVVHLLANSGWSWHLHCAPAVWVAKRNRVPIVVNYRGGDAERFLQAAPSWVRQTLKSADACIVPSGFLQDVLQKFGITAEIIPNVIDLSRFRFRSAGRSGGRPHVIVTRNLESIYGIDTAIRAFALVNGRIPEARFTIAGEGPQRPQLVALTSELGIETCVRFPGRLSRDEIAQLYRDADVMLNPSTIDNMPNSILEAYASGVPVVSTNVGGVPYLARDGDTALLVAPGEPAAMADAVCRLLHDPVLASRLAAHGLDEARRYGWSEIRLAWLQLYSRLAERAGSGLGHR